MTTKGNLIENWQNQYADLAVTYSTSTDTPIDFAQMEGYKFIHEDVAELLPGKPDAKILEVGCGSARNSLYLALHGYNVTCADFADGALRLAENNFAAMKVEGAFVQDDLMNSNLEAESFDCVMSFGLLEHFERIDVLAERLTKLVKPGGIQLHLVVPKKFSTQTLSNLIWFPYKLLHFVKNRDFRNIVRRSYRDFPHFENTFAAREYQSAFAKAGNEIIRCEPQDVIFPLIRVPPPALGNAIVRAFRRPLKALYRLTHRGKSNSAILQFLSPAFVVACRKADRPH